MEGFRQARDGAKKGHASKSMLGPNHAFLEVRSLRAGDRVPVFRRDAECFASFYAPGCLVVVDSAEADRFEATLGPSGPAPDAAGDTASRPDWAAELWRHAEAAVDAASALRDGSFQPECLTLYLNTECNLRCSYCHTDPTAQPAERLDAEAVAAAALVVAESCRQKGLPFTVVFHGGGEPTLDRSRVDQLLDLAERIAAEHDLEPFHYVATNGLLSEEGAAWLALRFDLVGLSCDGPASIHDCQRPRWDGRASLPIVERTGRILGDRGCRYHVRTTITPEGMEHQAAIADYLCGSYAPEEIHFEPVYVGGRTGAGEGFQAHHAEAFTAGFLAARAIAHGYGVPLLMSGTRLGQIHGPYCHVYRHTLNLVPGGVATACFKLTAARQVREAGAALGQRDSLTGRFAVDGERVQALQRHLDAPLSECATCFNRYHCARECPDWCPLDLTAAASGPGFRCLVQRAIAAGILQETAERLWAEARANRQEGPHGTWIA